MIHAEVICDSISPAGIRLTTMSLRYPKFIHGEFMTHRVFSRNASSSRAIPTARLLEEVRSDHRRAAPVWWGANQKGMQAAAELTNVEPDYKLSAAKDRWRSAALSAARYAEDLMNLGAHKQIVNRILEPYLHISVLVTATEYANFFGLRLDAAAQPEMRELAEAMWAAWNESVTLRLEPGQWHLPYIGRGDEAWLQRTFNTTVKDDYDIGLIRKVSLARCARVSYQSFETGRRSEMEEDLALGERLLASKHLSPLEHQATPDELDEAGEYRDPGAWGNLVGWRQYRKMITGEAVAPLPEPYSWKDRDHDPV